MSATHELKPSGAPTDAVESALSGQGVAAANDATTGLAQARRLGRAGVWLLLAGLAVTLAWIAFAPLDEGVPAPGMVVVDTKRKAVQHLSGGIVRAVLVHEGDSVRLGQTLVELDPGVARASYESVRQQYLGLRAMEGRLVAERSGVDVIRFHPDVTRAATADPQIGLQMAGQEQLFAMRRAALRADLQSIEESRQGQAGSLEAYRSMQPSRATQLALLREELAATRSLVEEGYAPRNRQLELERLVADAQAAAADLQGNVVRSSRGVAELAQRATLRRSEYGKEVGTQLAEVQRQVQAEEQKFAAAGAELERMAIRSPSAGHVVGLTVQTVGGVIQPAQKLMDVVPEGEVLTVEAHVPPHLIDRIRGGLPVDVRFASFAHAPQLVVAGTVTTVSADLLTDPQTNVGYYLARVAVTAEGLKTLGKRVLQPGMPCELVFKTGQRSLLTYLLHPLSRRLSAAMTEE
jgi:protease secretion system membrane fusion protein